MAAFISAIKETANDFCDQTTVHGPGHVIHSKSKWLKFMWTLLFLAAMAGVLYHLTMTMTDFFAYPYHMKNYIAANPPDFPDVTICNKNPVSPTRMERYMLQNPGSNTSWFLQQVEKFTPEIENQGDKFPHFDDYFGSSQSFFKNIGLSEAESISHLLKDLVLDCTYKGMPCTKEDFDLFVHPLYFNCYLFTGKVAKSASSLAGHGPEAGLSLVLYLEEEPEELSYYNRYSPIGNTIGASIEVHGTGSYPRPEAAGRNVAPGQSTAITLRSEKVDKLPHPYGNCTRRQNTTGHPEIPYSSTLCLTLCAQDYTFAECGCYLGSLPVCGEKSPTCGSFHLGDANTTDAEKLDMYLENVQCQRDAVRQFELRSGNQAACDCPTECQKTLYFPSLSSSPWPADTVHQDFLQEFLLEQEDKTLLPYVKHHHLVSDSADPGIRTNVVRTRFARVNVYFSDLEQIVREAVPSYTIILLMCDIGGTLGLWAGISIITCAELLELFPKFIWALIKKQRKKDSSPKVTKTQESA